MYLIHVKSFKIFFLTGNALPLSVSLAQLLSSPVQSDVSPRFWDRWPWPGEQLKTTVTQRQHTETAIKSVWTQTNSPNQIQDLLYIIHRWWCSTFKKIFSIIILPKQLEGCGGWNWKASCLPVPTKEEIYERCESGCKLAGVAVDVSVWLAVAALQVNSQ